MSVDLESGTAIDGDLGPARAELETPPLTGSGFAIVHSTPALRTYHMNPRQGDVTVIMSSLARNAQYRPIVVNAGTFTGRQLEVLAGNHTLLAARQLGWPTIQCWQIDVDEDTATRIVAADNRTADLGTYDEATLAQLLSTLDDLDGTGYSDDDLTSLLNSIDGGPEGFTEDDDAPEDAPALTKIGDVWLLGRHRLMCGSATDPDIVEELMHGRLPDLVYTDPPYGISIVQPRDGQDTGTSGGGFHANGVVGGGGPLGFDKSKKGTIGRGKIVDVTSYRPVIGDETTDTAVESFRLINELFPKSKQVWWGGNHYAGDAGLPNSSCWLVWDKNNGTNHFADCELAWTNHDGAVRMLTHTWNGMVRQGESGKRVHPTQKPVGLAEWAFGRVLGEDHVAGTAVLDLFAGSGSTLIAAHKANANGYMLELSPDYCDVICRRFQEHTQITPILERTGAEHDFTSANG